MFKLPLLTSDLCGHSTPTYAHPRLVATGTALYAYNDAVFTAEDWNGIQEIARSRKRDDPLKVGRFGIGFNSVYHVTGEDRQESRSTLCSQNPSRSASCITSA